MSLKNFIKSSLIRVFPTLSPQATFSKLLSKFLPGIRCVDVGASYYVHYKWYIFLKSPSVKWNAVEPNLNGMCYAEDWAWSCTFRHYSVGLSEFGGNRTLYVTNQDSGSSLLKPKVKRSMAHRLLHINDYFFPLREVEISTASLLDIVSDSPVSQPILVKLDTQGTELSILRGALPLLESAQIVGIELESTLVAEPVMDGSGKFWEVCEFLEGLGYEVLLIDVISQPGPHASKKSQLIRVPTRTYANECDAVFSLRRDKIESLPINHRMCCLAFYLSYMLVEEALSLLTSDVEMQTRLAFEGCNVDYLISYMRKLL